MQRRFAKRLLSRSKSARQPRRRRLCFEAIEARQLLTTFFVNGVTGSDLNPGTGASPFATIQRAVDAADETVTPGADTILVATGVYTEDVDIDDDHPLTIRGTGNVTVSGGGVGEPFNIDDSNVALILLSITGSSEDGVDSELGSLTLQQVRIFGNAEDGVDAEDLTLLSIANSSIFDNRQNGVEAFDLLALTAVNSSFSDNDIDGIFAEDVVTTRLTNVVAELNDADGVHLSDSGAVVAAITIQGGRYSNNDDHGIDLLAAADGTVISLSNVQANDNGDEGLLAGAAGIGGRINIVGLQANGNDDTGALLVGEIATLTGVTANNNGFDGVDVSADNLTISTLTANNTGRTGLLAFAATIANIRGVNTHNNPLDGVALPFGGGDYFLGNIWANGNVDNGLFVEGVNSLVVQGGYFDGNGGSGLFVTASGNITLRSVVSRNNGAGDGTGDDGVTILECGNIVMQGVTCQNNNGDGAHIEDSGTVMLSGVTGFSNAGNGLDVSGSGPLTVVACQFAFNVGLNVVIA